MSLTRPPLCDFGWQAPDFTLTATTGRRYGLSELRGDRGTVVMFICNHCPYVVGVIGRIVSEARALEQIGIGVAAICSNDPDAYPQDSFDNMARFADRHAFAFPYLHDPDQSVARAYDAVCTPDFFGFDADLGLQYRGRLDSAGNAPAGADTRRELFEAMRSVAAGGEGPQDQIPSMGCSIKWKAS